MPIVDGCFLVELLCIKSQAFFFIFFRDDFIPVDFLSLFFYFPFSIDTSFLFYFIFHSQLLCRNLIFYFFYLFFFNPRWKTTQHDLVVWLSWMATQAMMELHNGPSMDSWCHGRVPLPLLRVSKGNYPVSGVMVGFDGLDEYFFSLRRTPGSKSKLVWWRFCDFLLLFWIS